MVDDVSGNTLYYYRGNLHSIAMGHGNDCGVRYVEIKAESPLGPWANHYDSPSYLCVYVYAGEDMESMLLLLDQNTL